METVPRDQDFQNGLPKPVRLEQTKCAVLIAVSVVARVRSCSEVQRLMLDCAAEDGFNGNLAPADEELAPEEQVIGTTVFTDIVGLQFNEVSGVDVDQAHPSRVFTNGVKLPAVVPSWQVVAVGTDSNR